MKTAFLLLALTLISAFVATGILGTPLRSSTTNPSPRKKTARPPRSAFFLAVVRQVAAAGRRVLHASAAHGARPAIPASLPALHRQGLKLKPAPRIARANVPPILERPIRSPEPKSQASWKLLLSIFAVGGGIAIFALLALRWIGTVLQQMSS